MQSHILDGPGSERRWRDARPAAGAVAGTALIGKAFSLIDIIGEAPGLITAKDLLARSGWPRATLYRILAALTQRGFVRFDPGQDGYTLGYRLIELAQNVWAGSDLASVASVELRRLRDVTGETAYLSVLHDGAMIALGKFESPHSDRSSARLGARKPLHCTSQGKALLAFLSPHQRDALLERIDYEAFTPHTITRRKALIAQLAIIRHRGYAIDDEEILLGNRCVGAPILDSAGRPVGAISVAGPIYRLTSGRAEQLGTEVAAAARHVSMQFKPQSPVTQARDNRPSPAPGQGEPARYGMCPVWDEARGGLTWLDVMGPRLHEYADGAHSATNLDFRGRPRGFWRTPAGSCVVWSRERTLITRRAGADDAAPPASLATVEAIAAGGGRVWAADRTESGCRIGVLSPGGLTRTATLKTRVDALAWSDVGNCLIAADSSTGTLLRVGADGEVRVLCHIPRVSGEPRGVAVDGAGRIWVALYDGWGIMRLTREGEIDMTLAMPVPRPTGLVFGGPRKRTLFITTARHGLSMDALTRAPESGLLFVHNMS